MVAAAETLRVTVNQECLITFTDLNTAATWAIRRPLLRKFIIGVELLALELFKDVRMVWAIEVATNQSNALAFRIVAFGREENLDVLEDAIGV